jgi:hypothetical protein
MLVIVDSHFKLFRNYTRKERRNPLIFPFVTVIAQNEKPIEWIMLVKNLPWPRAVPEPSANQ